jgi:hypothetical protein
VDGGSHWVVGKGWLVGGRQRLVGCGVRVAHFCSVPSFRHFPRLGRVWFVFYCQIIIESKISVTYKVMNCCLLAFSFAQDLSLFIVNVQPHKCPNQDKYCLTFREYMLNKKKKRYFCKQTTQRKKNKPVYHLVDLNSMRVIIATVLKLPTVATRFATISVYSLVDASSSCSDTTLYTRVTTLSILCSTLEERRALVRPSPSTPMMTPMMTIMMVQSVYARLRDGDPHVSHSVR